MAENSPFHKRSGLTARSPPPTPPTSAPPLQQEDAPPLSAPAYVPTADIQVWMTQIEQTLQEVCTIASEGKLNSEQKMRVSSLCRKVSNGTSQMAVQYQAIKQKAFQYYQAHQTLQEKLDMSLKFEELKRSVEESTRPVPSPRSFAEILKLSTDKHILPSPISSVVIYPSDKQKTSEQTKSLVQKIIRPEEMQLHVRGLRKIKNGGVVISTNSKDDIQKIKQSSQLATSGLMVDEPQKRRPRIIVIGVPSAMQEAEVFKCIYKQNLADKFHDISLDKFLTMIKLSHKSGKKDSETCNYVIEVSAQIRKALISSERLFVNWSSCPVRDFTLVTRCYRCQQYGHAAKSCKMEVDTCGHCGVVGHAMKDCTKNTEPPKCATCLLYKKPSNHKTGDTECPARKMAEKRYINSIDYECA